MAVATELVCSGTTDDFLIMNKLRALLTATYRIACPALLLMLGSTSQAAAQTEEDGRYWLSVYAQGKLPVENLYWSMDCLLYTSPSPRDVEESRMPSSA